jgi:hypothetical protein
MTLLFGHKTITKHRPCLQKLANGCCFMTTKTSTIRKMNMHSSRVKRLRDGKLYVSPRFAYFLRSWRNDTAHHSSQGMCFLDVTPIQNVSALQTWKSCKSYYDVYPHPPFLWNRDHIWKAVVVKFCHNVYEPCSAIPIPISVLMKVKCPFKLRRFCCKL